MRDLLVTYMEHLRLFALEGHQHNLLVWANLASLQKKPGKPPEEPSILRAKPP